MYNDVFAISDLDDKENPYALVAVSPIDGLHELGPTYSRIRDFRLYGVNERYSLSLVEFLNLPRHIGDRIIEDAKLDISKLSAIRDTQANKVENKFKKEGFNLR